LAVARWTIALVADRLVKLKVLDSVSAVDDVLEVYHRPHARRCRK
jgi:hypothetical protein